MAMKILYHLLIMKNKILMDIQIMITINHLIMESRMIQVIKMMVMLPPKTRTTTWMTNTVNIRQKITNMMNVQEVHLKIICQVQ